ncbi:MAG TPA: hypothetical protein PKA13_02590 [Geminicoccaceae bacterium]|nr:hypothetical protein [Geminicoccus sp.]HMU48633.1 hypothetical protein [Geminicoccaceae bacterium]
MTSRSSSISSSEARRFLLIAGAASLLLVGLVCATTWQGIRQGLVGWSSTQLLRYQIAKIEAAPRIDLLLVGDSTLANAVDAEAWSEATGLSVVSVALTGAYGYEGSLNMVRRALRREQRPHAVLVMQAFDMPTRRISYEGLLYTAERPADLAGAEPWKLVEPLANLDLALAMLDPPRAEAAFRQIERYDYPPQRARPDAGGPPIEESSPLTADMIRPAKGRFLHRLGRLCAEAGIACIYVQGPYPAEACAASADYAAAARRFVVEAGLVPVDGTPVCLPPGDIGDAEDHVRPERRAYYSRLHLELARAALGLDWTAALAPAAASRR